jgi:bifunctional DNA-binding transcriptional regulator/antitoxin component of YhaV-PrlF toxin-antitoxin module
VTKYEGFEHSHSDLTDELPLGVTILSAGGRTTVPGQVREVLKLRYTPQEREKILWTQKGDKIVVSKGTAQSSFRKTLLCRDGKAAVPKHITKALKLMSTVNGEDRVAWILIGDEVIVRKGAPQSSPTG